MINRPLPRTNLKRLKSEILDRGPDAALPCNLSSRWLELIERDLDMVDRCDDGRPDSEAGGKSYASAPLALICSLLMGQTKRDMVVVPLEVLYQYFFAFEMEINLEIMRRQMAVEVEPASLETMFVRSHRTVV